MITATNSINIKKAIIFEKNHNILNGSQIGRVIIFNKVFI